MNPQHGLVNRDNKKIPPFIVNLRRGKSIESVHRVHAVVCDEKGRVLMQAGDYIYETFN